MVQTHEFFMQRCLQLAALGEGFVAPNPMVGSVLVFNGRLIGEGYHQQYGEAHAEVNCLNNVAEADRHLITSSTLYVSLEPCAHYGKTPPCADSIIQSDVRKVVIGCRDPFVQVNGKGIEKLQKAGVQVVCGVLEKECQFINRRFFTYHTLHRPYVALKWAQTSDGFIGSAGKRLYVSNAFTGRMVHQVRSSNMGILIGTKTALADNPHLNIRHAAGHAPVRLVIDLQNRLRGSLNIFDNSQRTFIFTHDYEHEEEKTKWISIRKNEDVLKQVLQYCHERDIQSILVEGGAITLQSFIDAGLWDEATVIQSKTVATGAGIAAPSLKHAAIKDRSTLHTDEITFYLNQNNR